MCLTFKDLKSSWKIDSIIDDLNIQQAVFDTPRLHSRYLGYLIDAKRELKQASNDCVTLRRELIKYYNGQMEKAELEERKWNQYQGKKPLKGELETLIQGHPDYISLEDRLSELEIVIESLESIMKMIYQRSYDIKNIIQARIFESGA